MKLYGTAPSRALRVLWLLNELEIECEIITVNLGIGEQRQPPFLSLNPAGKIPVLVDGDVVVTESSAIALYLADKHPEKGFIPATAAGRAEMYRWIFFLTTEIELPLWRMALHQRVYPEAERRPEEIALAARDCRQMLAVLERHMQGREFLGGDRPSVADFNAAFTLDWAREARLLDDTPRLREYLAAMYARPGAPQTLAESFAQLQRDYGVKVAV